MALPSLSSPFDLRRPPRLPLIAPSILSADFANMETDCRDVLAEGLGGRAGAGDGADLLHLDVMDGHFVPNLTMGSEMCRGLRRALPESFLDVHLMVTDPGLHIDPFLKAGANHITFHVEVLDPGAAIELGGRVRRAGATAGLAINPPTPVDRILPLVPHFDMLLVMSVNPGFSGQKFIADVLAKTRAIRAVCRPDQRVEMDGGINLENAAAVREAGCDVLVAATAVFGVAGAARRAVIAGLRR